MSGSLVYRYRLGKCDVKVFLQLISALRRLRQVAPLDRSRQTSYNAFGPCVAELHDVRRRVGWMCSLEDADIDGGICHQP